MVFRKIEDKYMYDYTDTITVEVTEITVPPEISPDDFLPPLISFSTLIICSGGTDIDCIVRSVR